MIGLGDRQMLAQDIDIAHTTGARLKPACAIVGISVRTLQRWQASDGQIRSDARPMAVRPTPAHALTQAERARLLAVANESRFAQVPPARIVPMLADEGVYLASESTFSRVLRAHAQMAHRGRAKMPKATRAPTTHIAMGGPQPMAGDVLLTGYLIPPTSFMPLRRLPTLSCVKIQSANAARSGQNYGVDYRSVMLTNLYDQGDNYQPDDAQVHVISELIRRFHEAKSKELPRIAI